MKNGGYAIIDFKDTDLTSGVASTIDGVYEAIEGSYRKPLLLSGIVIGSVEKNDIFVEVNVSGSDYEIVCYGGTIVITSADAVTYTASE